MMRNMENDPAQYVTELKLLAQARVNWLLWLAKQLQDQPDAQIMAAAADELKAIAEGVRHASAD